LLRLLYGGKRVEGVGGEEEDEERKKPRLRFFPTQFSQVFNYYVNKGNKRKVFGKKIWRTTRPPPLPSRNSEWLLSIPPQ
jgi:hypothetical protein